MRCSTITDVLIADREEYALQALQESGATTLTKGLQALELQRASVAVGMFAMLEAALQDALGCAGGFKGAMALMTGPEEQALRQRFWHVQLAVNALKHGQGRGYQQLLARRDELPFEIFSDGDDSEKGDVAATRTLVRADSALLHHCAETIDLVAALVRRRVSNSLA